MALNTRRQAFVLAYAETGNGTEAARRAGYAEKSAYVTADRLLKNAEVKEAIRSLQKEKFSANIATAEERQAFWSETMRDKTIEYQHRLKASELLGKCGGDFLDRHEITGKGGGPITIKLGDTDVDPEELGW